MQIAMRISHRAEAPRESEHDSADELEDTQSVTHPDSDMHLPGVEFSEYACLESVDACEHSCHRVGQ